MKIKNCKLIAVILLVTISQLLATNPVQADDMGQTKTKGVSVVALVGPQIPDFQFSLAEQNNATTIHEGEYHTYVVTYGAKQSAQLPTDDTITVSFANDLAPNSQHIFDYVDGSASYGYGNAKPIVDLVNRTITWDISSLPAGTIGQKVYFNLFTNTYQTTNSFDISLTATMSNQYVTMPDQTLTQHYEYQTPPPGPTATPGPQPTSAPTPTPAPAPPAYNVDITNITNNSATIHTTTTYPTQLTINYGTSPGSLTQSVSNNTYQTANSTTLTNLKPDTTYYFSLTFTYENGRTLTSETYTFHTATQALSALPLNGTAVISSGNAVLLSEVLGKNMSPGFALLTATLPYDITVSPPQGTDFRSLELLVENQQTSSVEMSKEQNGLYTAHMTPLNPGIYTILLKTLDDTGTLSEQEIATLKVIAPLSVTNKQSGAPLENARIFLWYFDQNSNTYKPINQGLFGIGANPGYTDGNGIYAVNLPPGKYKATASALFYDPAEVTFALGPVDGQEFPQIKLTYDPTNLGALLIVGKNYLFDLFSSLYAFLHTIATSSRIFQLVGIVTIGSLVFLGFITFIFRTHSTFKYIPLFFLFEFDILLQRHKGKYLFGKVTDADSAPLSLVRVEVEDADSKTILRHTMTNKTGKFYFLNKFTGAINLLFIKEGFRPESRSLPKNDFPETGLKIMLESGEPHHASAIVLFGRGLKDILGMLFETALVLSIILEILFCIFYGFSRTAPFLILSIINILLWIFYLHQAKIKETLS